MKPSLISSFFLSSCYSCREPYLFLRTGVAAGIEKESLTAQVLGNTPNAKEAYYGSPTELHSYSSQAKILSSSPHVKPKITVPSNSLDSKEFLSETEKSEKERTSKKRKKLLLGFGSDKLKKCLIPQIRDLFKKCFEWMKRTLNRSEKNNALVKPDFDETKQGPGESKLELRSNRWCLTPKKLYKDEIESPKVIWSNKSIP
ncbi:hypothetical protein O181_015830 [Austropuccinia psidii MF-1]|uniref:Uncharacterized protein n=1 Tax=Austropuccinia psidii MF-1 TaxID=1389203 RepID=A0A9Q3C4M5_9BASI|nr:hypothetical protein [Austropuccinia psidii MF-1]